MNFGIIKRTIGWILLFETCFFLVPAITAAVYWEKEFFDILISMCVSALFGGLLILGKPKSDVVYAKEGFVIVAISWIILSLFGSLPFYISGAIPSFIDALFETVSGFSTTGASILSGEQIEALPKCLLMWRSFTHWVGGMGVLVFILAFLPLCGGGHNINLLRAESPGPSVSKLAPKMRSTAGILYLIYTVLTVLQFVLLLFGTTVFDALNIAFATAGTGGFALKGDGLAGYSPYVQVVVTVFMILYSINFASFFFIIRGKLKEAFNAEVRVFLTIVVLAVTLISINLCLTQTGLSVGEVIRHSAFSVASVVSTTGFSTLDFNLWPTFSKTILVIIMFMGACAGSTGGGMKVSRFVILFKGMSHETKRMLHPKQVKKVHMDNHVVEEETIRGIFSYLIAFIAVFLISLLIISLDGYDVTTSFTAIVATINNIGPGLGEVGPAGNYAFFSWWSKLVLIFDMLAGRLEIFPMLLLFLPATWRK